MFQAFIENGKTLTEEQVRALVKKEKFLYDQNFDSFYYESVETIRWIKEI